ncbi:uncharacterized protein CDAR_506651 [Caerostris darwini]|uniref:Uncharacterized protein n=1 Tax=Caerostris darwini TaxID=1538125 RepID=A0AAV4WWC3_9ARAC|nr:uncharacterized protein CDAR_506651 [Caerostris darwini]
METFYCIWSLADRVPKELEVTVALPPEVQPFPSWTQKNKNDLGTHFVRSVTYGGELLASIRFKANKDSDFNAISAEIESNFNGGDAQNLVAEEVFLRWLVNSFEYHKQLTQRTRKEGY